MTVVRRFLATAAVGVAVSAASGAGGAFASTPTPLARPVVTSEARAAVQNPAPSRARKAPVRHRRAKATPEPVVPAVVKPPRQTTLLATIVKPTADYAAPIAAGAKRAPEPIGTIPTVWHASPVTLPVIAQKPGWLDVRLPQRPNGSTAWIRSTAPRLSYTGYSITINTSTMHLELFLRGKLILDAPAGVGEPWDPTPLGSYFVAYLAQPPTSGYGPFVIVTSAHSNSITDWESSGDAEIGIHGPLGMDAAIGTTGAQVSHGCVRLHVSDLVHLRDVPLGAPVNIIS